mmetsp:Transcript_20431/g.39926  ORF Transcript_20431/g.39926 Transcript_20431/m.39926 type:complete len:208 (+) Transcript_20431:486-1109(+)
MSNSARTAAEAASSPPASAHTRRTPTMERMAKQPAHDELAPLAAGSERRTTAAVHDQCRPGTRTSSHGRRGRHARSTSADQFPGRSCMVGRACTTPAPSAVVSRATSFVSAPVCSWLSAASTTGSASVCSALLLSPIFVVLATATFRTLDHADANFKPHLLSLGDSISQARGDSNASSWMSSLRTISKPCFSAQANTASKPPLATET